MIQKARYVSIAGNSEDYRASEGISSSGLRNFATCPARFKAGYVPPDTDAKEWGSLVDCLLLTPQQFDTRYSVKPDIYTNEKGEKKPWNGNANVCREWVAEQIGKEIVARDKVTDAKKAIKALMQDATILSFIEESDKQVWIAAEWHDDTTGLTVPIKALLDLVPRLESEFAKCAGDVKTTRNAGLIPWQRWLYQAGYHVQAAWNLDLLTAVNGEDRNTFCFILSESFSPWQTSKRILSQDFLELGRAAYKRMISNYCRCLKADRWPGYDDTDENSVQGWSLATPEPWMSMAEQFAPQFDFESEPAAIEA